MTLKIRSFLSAALLCASATVSLAQQGGPQSQQPPLQRDDPATVGAGSTSGLPGRTKDDPPKGASVTTDDRGVTTTNPAGPGSKSDGVRPDPGNDSNDVTGPEKK